MFDEYGNPIDSSMNPLTVDTAEYLDVWIITTGERLDTAWRYIPEAGYETALHEESYLCVGARFALAWGNNHADN